MSYYLAIDFGSTYTKLCAVDVKNKKVIGTSKAFTSIQTDIREGYYTALKDLQAATGKIEYEEKLACSSAGGGLKMIAVGLVPELTAKAAKMAASSAGAKVTDTFSYEINAKEQEEIFRADPDILLLCGGTDGGNKDVILHNAGKIAEINRNFSVIYAGNKSAADKAEEILGKAGKNTIICENVMPVFNVLNIEPSKKAIRDLFIERIIEAKGLSEIEKEMTGEIIPTPLVVFEGANRFAGEIGELMAIDIGGATTDVYSMSEGHSSLPNVIVKGLPEPFAKRSVEGDLGLRYNIGSLLDSAIANPNFKLRENNQFSMEEMKEWVKNCTINPEIISQPGSIFRKIEEFLSFHAVLLAVERHCGTMEKVYTPQGETMLVTGKDLSRINVLIGIGGPIINSENPSYILRAALSAIGSTSGYGSLKPVKPLFYLDKNYVFSAMGLISRINTELALHIMKEEITEIERSI